jgi:sugar (pentulose or hexulose) kinase
MYIGIDLGTSGVKAILFSEQGDVLATQTEKLQVSRPHPLWSEQDPEQWWQATDRAMKALGEQHSLRDVKALGIAGQMHGATLLIASIACCVRLFSGTMAAARRVRFLRNACPLPGRSPAT